MRISTAITLFSRASAASLCFAALLLCIAYTVVYVRKRQENLKLILDILIFSVIITLAFEKKQFARVLEQVDRHV